MIDITVNVDEKLSLNKFEVDEENAQDVYKRQVPSSVYQISRGFF